MNPLIHVRNVGKRNRNHLKQAGMTMVEMIVSFVLLSLIMVAATVIINYTVRLYYQSKGVQMGSAVSGVLFQKIEEHLEGAQNKTITSDVIQLVDGTKAEGTVILNGSQAELYNKDGSHVLLHLITEDGKQYLSVRFFKVVKTDEDTGVENQLYKEVEWQFDQALYMGYSIADLRFEKAGSEYQNIIKVTLNLTNPKYGNYETNRLIKCYNLKDTAVLTEITP